MTDLEGGYVMMVPARIDLTPARIAFDEDAVRAKVKNLTQWYTDTTADVLATMKPSEVRSCRSDLIAIKKDVEDARKTIKREYMKPLNDFEARVKDIETAIDTPLEIIRTFISEQEEARRTERYRALEELYEAYAGTICAYAPFERVCKKEWLNKTVSMDKAEKEIIAKVSQIAADVKVMESMPLTHRTAVMDTYARTMSLSDALGTETRLNATKESVEEMDTRKRDIRYRYELVVDCTQDEMDEIARFAHGIGVEIQGRRGKQLQK